MKAKAISVRPGRFPPDSYTIDPHINTLLENSHVRCSCVSREDFDASSLWPTSCEKMSAYHHRNGNNLLQIILSTPRSSVVSKKSGNISNSNQKSGGNRQSLPQPKRRSSEFQHFLTTSEHIDWYREAHSSCLTLGCFPHFAKTFHPSMSIAQAVTIGTDNYNYNDDSSGWKSREVLISGATEQHLSQMSAKRFIHHNTNGSVAATSAVEDRNSDGLSSVSNADRSFYPVPVTLQEPSNGFISSFFPKLHRSSYYRAHTQRKLLHQTRRLHPHTYGKLNMEAISGFQYIQPKQLSIPMAAYEEDSSVGHEGDDSQTSPCHEYPSSVDLTDQDTTPSAVVSSVTWEVDHANGNVLLPFATEENKRQNKSLKMAVRKLSAMQRRRYIIPSYSLDMRQDSPKPFEVTGMHYTTLVSPIGTTARLPKQSPNKQLIRKRSDIRKTPPLQRHVLRIPNNHSIHSDSKIDYNETYKHIFPFKNEEEQASSDISTEKWSSQRKDISLHSNCISKSRRKILHKYLSSRLQSSNNFDRLSKQGKSEHTVRLGIIMPNVKEALLAAQETAQ
ncbi:uncharacterized protein [Dysidea avara]|uniref:uncharacterized protein isoform X2 n=1 Tax=Dysidea avara TaxID=196820 RepID=UPI003328A064